MADGHEAPAYGTAKPYVWTELFRCFQVALDPRKLLVAAAGILAMSLGWYLLSTIFYHPAPDANSPEYSVQVLEREYKDKKKADKSDYTAEDFKQEAAKRYQRDAAEWKVLDSLAGPDGRGKLRTMPWYEDRNESPYLFLTQLSSAPSSTWAGSIFEYVAKQLPVMAEPLVKLLTPVIKIADPNASTMTRFYLLLVILWSAAVWAFAGGIITRIAAVQLSGKDRISLGEAVKFVTSRYLSYLLAPIVPLGIIGVVTLALMLFGFIALVPILGDVLYALGLPLVILGGIVMAILLIGLVGYPLMYTTLSTEGSDTFDALSRSYNYVFQSPWKYIWYSFIAVVYGAIVTFFVVFVASLMVYMGKWAITKTPLSETTNQKADYLFVYAPESFGWKELLLRGTDLEKTKPLPVLANDGTVSMKSEYVNKVAADKYMSSFQPWNYFGTGMATFWLVLVFMLMLGFSYSFFWSASTMIYLLMRNDVDEVELDEVYLEDDEPQTPLGSPSMPASVPAADGKVGLPTVPAPAPIPPVVVTGPVGALSPPAETPKES